MDESQITSIHNLPDDIIRTVCQLLIDSRCSSVNYSNERESTATQFSLSNACKDVCSLKLTCSHFLNLIDQLCLKMPVLVGGSSAKFESEKKLCKHIMDKGLFWKINKFGIEVSPSYSQSDVSTFIGQIRWIIDNRIKLLHYSFVPTMQRRFSPTMPNYQNRFYSVVSDYCNDDTRIIVYTHVVTGTELNQIGVPRIDTCSYIELQMDAIPFIQNMEISKLSLITLDHFSMGDLDNFHGSSKNRSNAMRSVTYLSFEFSDFSDNYGENFFINHFPCLEVLDLSGSLNDKTDRIILPESCEAVNIRYENLQSISQCPNIKYLALDGDLDVDEFYFTTEILESLKFSLHALNFNLLKREDEDCGEIAVELQRLLQHQANLKVLSVSLFDGQPRYIEVIFDDCKNDLVKFIKAERGDMELFIFGDKLTAVNKNLSRETVGVIDAFDSEYEWSFRRRENRSPVSLDPADADLTLPSN